MEKLVRGVIYDDVDLDEMKEGMFNFLERMDDMDRAGVLENRISKYAEKLNMSSDEAYYMFKNMDAVAALTRMNPLTFETHNMIIPKESLSKNMVEELSIVDLGKNIIDDYARHYIDAYEEDDEDELTFEDTVYNCNDFSSAEEIAKKIMETDPNNFLIVGGDINQINDVFNSIGKMKKVG